MLLLRFLLVLWIIRRVEVARVGRAKTSNVDDDRNVVGAREMRDGRVSLRERDGAQADVSLAEAVSRLRARARPGALVAEAS